MEEAPEFPHPEMPNFVSPLPARTTPLALFQTTSSVGVGGDCPQAVGKPMAGARMTASPAQASVRQPR